MCLSQRAAGTMAVHQGYNRFYVVDQSMVMEIGGGLERSSMFLQDRSKRDQRRNLQRFCIESHQPNVPGGAGDTGRGTPPPHPRRRAGPSRGASAAGRSPGEEVSSPAGRVPGTFGRFFPLLQIRPSSLLIPGDGLREESEGGARATGLTTERLLDD
ncbi:hypothetical protein NHX12_009898 [Muraenolepis orangiensis]|uniref:Uncharacterized protein n=1 Tax=Muraenolepis orangiensis TaxID=630683 RepID=A0A9Q0DI31_9TELE|nr:hypothetical protein NHX12_009898 [Muraenolepis orangiensis]